MTESPRHVAENVYRVRTWDTYANDFTAQEGVPEYVTGFAGLRQAIRLLREQYGYCCDRTKHGGSDPSVLIERV